MITLTLVTALILLLAATATATARTPAAKQQWQQQYAVFMTPMWQRLAICESGSNPPNWKHDSGTYEGAFGFYEGTWDQYKYAGYPSSAAAATPFQQYRVALRLFALYGYSPWGCFRHSWVRYGQ